VIRAIALLLTAALAVLMFGCGGSAATTPVAKTEYVVALQCGDPCPWLPADGDWGSAATFDDAKAARAQALTYLLQCAAYEEAAGVVAPGELEGVVSWEVTLWSPGGDQDFEVPDRVEPPRVFDVLLHSVVVD
jgi:hypothetical protein